MINTPANTFPYLPVFIWPLTRLPKKAGTAGIRKKNKRVSDIKRTQKRKLTRSAEGKKEKEIILRTKRLLENAKIRKLLITTIQNKCFRSNNPPRTKREERKINIAYGLHTNTGLVAEGCVAITLVMKRVRDKSITIKFLTTCLLFFG